MPNKRKDLRLSGPNLWYLVGLITSDGCLSSDGRHIDITSKDYIFLFKIKAKFGFVNKIGEKYNALKQKSFHIQISNKNFYEFLLSIGLMPNKSLSLGALRIPAQFFTDFVRGLIDGDGCIRRWIHPSNKREQWSLRIFSGSEIFLKWLNKSISRLLKVQGRIHNNVSAVWVLKYGKMAAQEIASSCYYENCFGLERKIKLARDCRSACSGWSKSKTVLS